MKTEFKISRRCPSPYPEGKALNKQITSGFVIPARFKAESSLTSADDGGFRPKACRNDGTEQAADPLAYADNKLQMY